MQTLPKTYPLSFKGLWLTMKLVKKILPLRLPLWIRAHYCSTTETPKKDGGSVGLMVQLKDWIQQEVAFVVKLPGKWAEGQSSDSAR